MVKDVKSKILQVKNFTWNFGKEILFSHKFLCALLLYEQKLLLWKLLGVEKYMRENREVIKSAEKYRVAEKLN